MKNHIAQKVRSAMKDQKITWAVLTEKSGCSSKIIDSVLKGGNYEINSLVKICGALEIKLF